MSETAANPLAPPCYSPVNPAVPAPGIERYQRLDPDLLSPRARWTRALRPRPFRQSARPAKGHSQPEATHPRSRRPTARPGGAVGAHRQEAASAARARRATLAAAYCRPRSGRAARDRPPVAAHAGGGAALSFVRVRGAFARRDRSCRSRAHRPAGADAAARRLPPRPRAAPAGGHHRPASAFVRIGVACRTGGASSAHPPRRPP